jgi:hypothetical protein
MLSVARNTIVSHSKGLQKQYERRVKISENTETISEKTEVIIYITFLLFSLAYIANLLYICPV